MVVAVGFIPGIVDPLIGIAIVAHLNADVGIGVAIVEIASFLLLKEFYENLFVMPWRGGDIGIAFFVALKKIVFLAFIAGIFLIEVLDVFYDFLRLFFHALHIKGHFSADHMFGILIFRRRIGVGVVFGTAMSASDDEALTCLGLDVVEEFQQDGIDKFFTVF